MWSVLYFRRLADAESYRSRERQSKRNAGALANGAIAPLSDSTRQDVGEFVFWCGGGDSRSVFAVRLYKLSLFSRRRRAADYVLGRSAFGGWSQRKQVSRTISAHARMRRTASANFLLSS